MNFNLVLDYFNNKGKQRSSMQKIKDAIEIMKKIIDGGIETINKDTIEENENDSKYEHTENDHTKEQKKLKQTEENFKLHDGLDCRILLEEFRKLFAQKPTSDNEDNAAGIIDNLFKKKEENNKKPEKILPNLNDNAKKRLSSIFRLKKNNSDFKAEEMIPKEMIFTNYIKEKLDKKDPSEISIKKYQKYKSLLLAFEETKKCLNNVDNSIASFNHTKSTGVTMNKKNDNNKLKGPYNTMSDWNKNDHRNNGSQSKFSRLNNNFVINKGVVKKMKLPDPQYNFNYQVKYFGAKENFDNYKIEEFKKFRNFLLPNIKKENSDYIPKNFLSELNP